MGTTHPLTTKLFPLQFSDQRSPFHFRGNLPQMSHAQRSLIDLRIPLTYLPVSCYSIKTGISLSTL